MKILETDICVIGAGSAGLSVAAGAAQLGRNVVLIEKGEMGGDCLNTGCVPSKALIAAANRAHAMREANKYGIQAADPAIDFNAVMTHVQGVIESIAPIDSQERFESLGVTVLREAAAFASPRQVKTANTRVGAKHFVVATGSSPTIPPIPGLDTTPFFTNETIFSNRQRPSHLIVIGGGAIGVELAQAHRRLGAKVTLVEADTILGKDDPALVSLIRAQLLKDGVELFENAVVKEVTSTAQGVAATIHERTVEGSHILVATGRTPSIETLNLEAAGVSYSKSGINVDHAMRTTNKRIYAIGDVAGGMQFTHVAGYHATLVIRNMLFKLPAFNKESLAPRVTYCDPPLAQIGLTESQARDAHGDNIKVAQWEFADNDRAQAERDTRGIVKVTTDKRGRLLGASIVGARADELIHILAYAIANKLKIKSLTNMIAPYPTRGEGAKRAAGAWFIDSLFSDRTKKLVSILSIFD